MAQSLKEDEKLLIKFKEYASSQGFKLNPNKNIVNGIIKGLIAKKKKFGEYYCPCRITNTEKDICPCYYHKEEIKQDGKCLCGLFVKS